MVPTPDPVELRRELTRVTRDAAIADHERLIDDLRTTHPHGIRLVERAGPDREFACVAYALDLAETSAIELVIAGIPGKLIAGPDLLTYMVRESMLDEIDASAATDGDLVVYSHDGQIEHVGLVDGERVRSKWGIGHTWRHPLLEVPERFGNSVRYYRSLSRRAALIAFFAYSRWRYPAGAVDRARRRLRRERAKATGG